MSEKQIDLPRLPDIRIEIQYCDQMHPQFDANGIEIEDEDYIQRQEFVAQIEIEKECMMLKMPIIDGDQAGRLKTLLDSVGGVVAKKLNEITASKRNGEIA